MRCLALADALAERGAVCAFATNEGALSLAPGLARHQSRAISVPAAQEAAFLSSLYPEGVDLLVVDHYERDAAFERASRCLARAILVIDDLADRPHDCDFLIDSTLGRQAADYAPLVPDSCLLMLGPDFALLRPEFAALRPEALARRAALQRVSRILVSFGASDPHDLAGRLVGPLLEALPETTFDVVAGGEPSERLAAAAARAPERVGVIARTDNMAALMAAADFAIGACGGTSWERCALGLPSAVVVTAENQRGIARSLTETGAAIMLGDVRDLQDEEAVARIASVLDGRTSIADLSRQAAELCDGRGLIRLIERVTVSLASGESGVPVRLALARLGDEDATYEIQAEPGARALSRSPAPPSRTEHAEWYARLPARGDRFLFVCRMEGEVFGSVRLDRYECERMEVSIVLRANARGRGLSKAVLADIRRLFATAHFTAAIRRCNAASIRAFASAGFIEEYEDEDGFVWFSASPDALSNSRSGDFS